METTAAPQSFIYECDADHDGNEEGPSYFRLDWLVEDWNYGNYYAATFLVSQVLNDSVSILCNRAAWCASGESGYEDTKKYLNTGRLLMLFGDLFMTYDGDVNLPLLYNGMLCYLTKAGGRRSDYF